jgi:hypothetical protein
MADKMFSCHKTVTHDDEGEPIKRDDELHCAGAAIVLEKMNRPNQMMRICERLGEYDRRKFKMDAPVFGSLDEFVKAQPSGRSAVGEEEVRKRC